MGTKKLSWLGVGLVISRLLVQFPAGALWPVLGQDSLFHIASVYPAAKWVPSINKAVFRACALYAASGSGISPREIETVSVCTGRPARGGRSCEHFGWYKTLNRIPFINPIAKSWLHKYNDKIKDPGVLSSVYLRLYEKCMKIILGRITFYIQQQSQYIIHLFVKKLQFFVDK